MGIDSHIDRRTPASDSRTVSFPFRLLHQLLLALFLAFLALPSGSSAQATDSARIAELERRLEAITRELERIDLGGDVVQADTEMAGLGPAASKVYRVERGVSIGGYGEFLYENFAADSDDGSV